jgi:hypothetical protein
MNLETLAQKLGLEYLTTQLSDIQAVEIAGGYASDLLSDVLANAPRGGVLVTLQVHLNVVAVASHAELSAVIFTAGRVPDADVIAKAVEEDVHLYRSADDTFETVGRLHDLGVKGKRA